MNTLEIAAESLEFDFKRDWQQFQGSRIKLFFVAYLRKQLRGWWRAMESLPPSELGQAQGAIAELRRMMTLVERPYCPDDELKNVVEFLTKKEKNYA